MPGVSEGVGLGECHAPTIRSKSDAVNDCHYCQFEKVVRNNVSGEIIRGVPCPTACRQPTLRVLRARSPARYFSFVSARDDRRR